MTAEHGCDVCKSHRVDALQQIGDVERADFLGGDHTEEQTHFRCTICGAGWTRIKERGAGGRATFWHPRRNNPEADQ